MVAFTRVRTQLLEEIADVKSAQDKSGREIPAYKLLLFAIVVSSVAVLCWPVFLSSWFRKKRTLLDATQEFGGKVIIQGYRKIAAQHGCAPTSKTTDQKIVQIYSKVGTAFKEAAQQRNEHIRADYVNTIVLKFFQVYELSGEEFMDEHLHYELQKYLAEGLRPDYKQALNLIDLSL